MQNERREPSMGMVKRMALTVPDQLVKEIETVRAERDNLKAAFTMKLSEYIRTIALSPTEILVIKKPVNMSLDLIREVVADLTERLRTRYSWEGVIVVQDALILGKLTPEEEQALLASLKEKLEKS